MNKKKIGIIGIGGIGARHAASTQQSAGALLVAGVDSDRAKREAFAAAYGVPTYATAEELLAAVDVDGVIISTPPCHREALLRPLLEANRHVLCEKPLAHTLETAKVLLELGEQYGKEKIKIGFCHRFVGATLQARALIQSGEIGEVVWMNIVFASNTPEMQGRWMTDPSLSGGGAAMDNAGHALDLFRFVVGSDIEANGFYRNSWQGRGEDSFVMAVQESRGAVGSILGSYVASTPRLMWEICGTEATLRFDYAGAGSEVVVISGNGSVKVLEVPSARDRFRAQIDAWAASMDGGESGLATLDDGYRISEMMDAIGHPEAQGVS